MAKRDLSLFSLLLIIALQVSGQVSFGDAERINSDWLFHQGEIENAQNTYRPEARWKQVELPHDWSVKGQLSPTLASATGYLPGGIGWYQKSLWVPEDKKDKKVYLYFEGVYNRSEVYVNGKLLGKRPNGYISFMYDATPYIEYGKENLVSVRVDHSLSADSRWYTGSGIYRNVWMIYANPVHIAQWGVYAYPETVGKKSASLAIETEVENGETTGRSVTVIHELLNRKGERVGRASKQLTVQPGQKSRVHATIKLVNPDLWSINTPNLYTLKTSLLEKGEVIDQTVTTTGIRSLTFDPDRGFALNGEWMKVKGVCIHHDAGVLGSAVPKEVWRKRLMTLKEIGCNAIRTSHNPQAPDLYELCDEIGLLVLNEAFDEWEFPKRKWLEGWNIGTPGYQGSYDFFEEWAEKDLAYMVRRDRNHVSVFAWSIGNEVDYPNDPYSHPVLDGGENTGFTQPIFGGYKKDAPDAMRLGNIAKRLASVVRQYDKSRPVTAGLAGVAMSNETEYPEALDIAGYNYTESMYDRDHAKYPNRVIYGSENRHELSTWKAVTEREFIFGQFLWTGIDYLGESGKWPSRGFYSGLLDFGGNIKPRGYFRQSLWSDQPMAYLGTYPKPGRGSGSSLKDVWSALDAENEGGNYEEKAPSMDAWPVWNYKEGELIRVVCYTNSAAARLLLNGKLVGQEKEYNTETGIIFWDIPYSAGKLEVEGLDKNGDIIARYALQSSGRPEALTVLDVQEKISKDKGLAQIMLQVVDRAGIPVMLSDDEITCRIEGPARLLGLEASNNEDMSDYTDNKHRAFNGKLLAYIQATGEPGEIVVQFSAPWLQAVTCTIMAE